MGRLQNMGGDSFIKGRSRIAKQAAVHYYSLQANSCRQRKQTTAHRSLGLKNWKS